VTLDLDAIRRRLDTFLDAYARLLRATEPGSGHDVAEARRELLGAAVDAASDVEALLAQVHRLQADTKMPERCTEPDCYACRIPE